MRNNLAEPLNNSFNDSFDVFFHTSDSKKDSVGLSKGPHPTIGINANRGCTDVLFFLLGAIVVALTAYVAVLSFKNGEPKKLLHGTDYLGNICGEYDSDGNYPALVNVTTEEWRRRKFLWYPITYRKVIDKDNPKNSRGFLSVFDALHMGVCVERCPRITEIVPVYLKRCDNKLSSFINGMYREEYLAGVHHAANGSYDLNSNSLSMVSLFNNNITNVTNTSTAHNLTSSIIVSNTTTAVSPNTTTTTDLPCHSSSVLYPVFYYSKPRYSRCVPDLTTFSCAGNENCKKEVDKYIKYNPFTKKITDFATSAFAEIISNSRIILICFIASVFISIFFFFIMRLAVKPIIYLLFLVVLVLLCFLGYFFFTLRQSSLNDEATSKSAFPKLWLALSIISFFIAFIILCVFVFCFKIIRSACEIIEESACVITSIPTIILVPIMFLLACVPLFIFFIYMLLYIQTSVEPIGISFDTNVFNQKLNLSNVSYLVNPLTNITYSMPIKSVVFKASINRTWAHVLNVFVFLWGFGILNAMCFFIIALCGVFWYWSAPSGESKSPPNFAIIKAAWVMFRYHVGTLMFGSLIIAIIQLFRVILTFIAGRELSKGSDSGHRNCLFNFVIVCLECYLECLQKVINFINKNAYIVCAMKGTSFIPSAFEGLSLFASNIFLTSITHIISYLFSFLGKLSNVSLTTCLAYILLRYEERHSIDFNVNKIDTLGSEINILTIVLIAIVAYFVSTIFLNVFSVTVDTIILCFCYDLGHNEINYFTPSIAKRIDRNGDALKAKATLNANRNKNNDIASVN